MNEATELLKDEDEVVKLDLKIQEKRLKVGAKLGAFISPKIGVNFKISVKTRKKI